VARSPYEQFLASQARTGTAAQRALFRAQAPRRPRPYVPPRPPAGSYDPSLDAAREAAERGYGDLRQDIETAGTRANVDYGLGREAIGRDFGRFEEDYQRNTGLLKQSFERLATRQAEGMNAAGVLNGGAAIQAAQKRAANQAQQQAQLDLARTRAVEDRDLGYGQLDLGYQRGGIDRTRTLERAGRENTAFGLDTGAQIAFQAAQSGWVPPKRPRRGRRR
jgi:hypothetical protein